MNLSNLRFGFILIVVNSMISYYALAQHNSLINPLHSTISETPDTFASSTIVDEVKIESHITYDNKAYCNHELDLTINISNLGFVPIHTLDYRIIRNERDLTNFSWTGEIPISGTAQIKIFNYNIPAGRVHVKIEILRINGSTNITEVSTGQNDFEFFTVQKQPTADFIREGFDVSVSGELPDNVLIDNPYNLRIFTVTRDVISGPVSGELGGFGQSSSSLRFDFFAIENGFSGAVVFNKINLLNKKDTRLVYSRAHAQRILENDRLIIQASTNCGLSWTLLENLAGAELRTVPQPSISRFYPNSNEWIKDTIDMGAFDNEEEVVLRFVGISDKGNCLYLDDIQVSTLLVNTENQQEMVEWKIYPNPAHEELFIQTERYQAEPFVYSILSLAGEKVFTKVSHQHNNTLQVLDLNEIQSPGQYILHIHNDKHQNIRKFIKL